MWRAQGHIRDTRDYVAVALHVRLTVVGAVARKLDDAQQRPIGALQALLVNVWHPMACHKLQWLAVYKQIVQVWGGRLE